MLDRQPLISEDRDLALIIEDAPCGELIAIVLTIDQVRSMLDCVDEIEACAMKWFEHEREAHAWFYEVSVTRPWEMRH